MDVEPVPRRGARVLLVDAEHRVLLLHGHDPADPQDVYWVVTGGGVETGESDREGAVRELFEETGLRARPDDLSGPVYTETIEFSFLGVRYRQDQVFFVLRVDGWDVDTSGFEPAERDSVDGHRWWTAAELRATAERYYPSVLADLLSRV